MKGGLEIKSFRKKEMFEKNRKKKKYKKKQEKIKMKMIKSINSSIFIKRRGKHKNEGTNVRVMKTLFQ